MPLRLTTPYIQEYTLVKTDALFPNETNPEPTKISVRQASTGDVELRGALFSNFKRTFDNLGNFSIEQEVTMDDVRRKEVFLTISACGIMNMEGKPLFHFENGKIFSEREFEIAWAQLPPEVSDEIHDKVIEHNKIWGPEGEATSIKQ